ncbi:HD-GYP domain-containing protein [Ectobacillus panaciterrae]|uniref:HD-GYP domain-containing protein n=1 Tax=Ectobacillus panaciterrae TaxID=363872 RepID=UPI00041B0312|nr:HD-GYP domain-containing protein [Ectobacillus panaciterrae]
MNSIKNIISRRLENITYARYAFFIVLFLSILLNGFVFSNFTLAPFFHLSIMLLGIAFWNKSKWFLFIFTSLITFCRFYFSHETFPLFEVVVLSHWITYFLITLMAASLTKNSLKAKKNSIDLVQALAKSLDARDPYTAFHSNNVANYALKIAEEIGLPKSTRESIYIGGLLHDIGKIGIPENILTKSSRLTEIEYDTIKKHPTIGYETLKHISSLQENRILDMIRYHHERYDGLGYPEGLKGDQIPLVARIMAIADSFDAMTSKRSYRSEQILEFAKNEIQKGLHTQFDPEVGNIFLDILKREGPNILQKKEWDDNPKKIIQ